MKIVDDLIAWLYALKIQEYQLGLEELAELTINSTMVTVGHLGLGIIRMILMIPRLFINLYSMPA